MSLISVVSDGHALGGSSFARLINSYHGGEIGKIVTIATAE